MQIDLHGKTDYLHGIQISGKLDVACMFGLDFNADFKDY